MLRYAIVETEEGLTVVEVPEHRTPEEVATLQRGLLVDSRLYESFQDAFDAMMLIPNEPDSTS
ncbi:MAG: hypothetical protein ACQESR_08790 [Planctomycetota bacterium]